MPGRRAPKRVTCDGEEWEVSEFERSATFGPGAADGSIANIVPPFRALIFRSTVGTYTLPFIPDEWENATEEELCRYFAQAKGTA